MDIKSSLLAAYTRANAQKEGQTSGDGVQEQQSVTKKAASAVKTAPNEKAAGIHDSVKLSALAQKLLADADSAKADGNLQPPSLLKALKKADSNDDKQITKGELFKFLATVEDKLSKEQFAPFKDALITGFEKLDRDQNGIVSKKELMAFAADRKSRNTDDVATPDSKKGKKLEDFQRAFQLADTDGNRTITEEELYSFVDSIDDGSLSPEELQKARRAIISTFYLADRHGDGNRNLTTQELLDFNQQV